MKSSVYGWNYVDNISTACLDVDSKSNLHLSDIPRVFLFYYRSLITKNSAGTGSLQQLHSDLADNDWILLSEIEDELPLLGARCHALVG